MFGLDVYHEHAIRRFGDADGASLKNKPAWLTVESADRILKMLCLQTLTHLRTSNMAIHNSL